MNARLKSLIHFLDDGIWRIREEEVSTSNGKYTPVLRLFTYPSTSLSMTVLWYVPRH